MIQWSKVLILSGPSGVGKDTVLDQWVRHNDRIERVVTCTTRAPRESEVHTVDYHFCTPDEFLQMVDAGQMIEHKEVYGRWYGSPLSEVERIQSKGNVAVLKIDVQGALDVMRRYPEVLSIFIMPPSMEELEERLKGRGTETPEEIEVRQAIARSEMDARHEYKVEVVNDSLMQVVMELDSLVQPLLKS